MLSKDDPNSRARRAASTFLVAAVVATLALVLYLGRVRATGPAPGGAAVPAPPAVAGEGAARALRGPGPAESLPRSGAPAGDARDAGGQGAGPQGQGHREDATGKTGMLAVQLELPAAAAEPLHWRLMLRPAGEMPLGDGSGAMPFHEAYAGRGRRVELELPAGSFHARAEASGLRSHPARVVIGAGAKRSTLVLSLQPLARVAGGVDDGSGAPVEGLEVSLRAARGAASAAAPLEEPRPATTDALGRFAIDEVLEGSYLLVLGNPEGPLTEPREVAVRGPFTDLETRIVPVLGTAELRVVDAEGVAVPFVPVLGRGSAGGWAGVETDAFGRASVRHLPPGVYRLFASHPAHGRGNAAFELRSGSSASVELRLRRAGGGR